MIVIIVIMAVVAVIGAALIGRSAGANGSLPTISGPVKDTPTGDCDQAGIAWDNARQMACNAKRDEDAARSRADGLRGQVIAAGVTLGGLIAAAAATYAAAAVATATIFGIPAGIVLTGIAVGLTVAAAAAQLILIGFTAALTAAEDDLGAKARVRQAWDAEVSRLRAEINSKCPPDKANAILSRPNPC